MLNIEMEFKNGILWVRLSGKLYENTVNTFNEEVLPVILKHGIMYVVVNLDKLNVIDIKGIETLMNLNDIVSFSNGKIILCSLTSNEVKEKLRSKEYISSFYETSNELTALGVMKI